MSITKGSILIVLIICLSLPVSVVAAQEVDKAIKIAITDLVSGFTDETVVRFHESATLSFDKGLDALKIQSPNNNVPTLFSLSQEKVALSINTIPNINGTSSVDLFVANEIESKYQVRLYLSTTLEPVNMAIFLIDRLQGCFYTGFRVVFIMYTPKLRLP